MCHGTIALLAVLLWEFRGWERESTANQRGFDADCMGAFASKGELHLIQFTPGCQS